MRKNEDWTTKNRNRISRTVQDTRDNLHQWSHAKIPTHQKNQEIDRRCDELEKRFTGKHEAAAHEESERLERQHTQTTAATTHEESEKLERQHAATTAASANEETAMFDQRTALTAARKEETIDSKDQELLAASKNQKYGQKRQCPIEGHP